MTSLFGNAISNASPPAIFAKRPGVTAVLAGVPATAPIQTNLFYGNLLVPSQDSAVWTHPYSVRVSTMKGFYGLVAYHGEAADIVYGPGTPAKYFFTPAGVNSVVLSAANFTSPPALALRNLSKFACTARFGAGTGYMDCPLVQGMGFVLAVYLNLIPQISSAVGFKLVTSVPSPRTGILKFLLVLYSGQQWTLYATIPAGQSLQFKLQGNNQIITSNSVNGAVFQLCCGSSPLFDAAAGCYPVAATVAATVSGSLCTYTIQHTNAGQSNAQSSLIFALPHHVQSFTSATRQRASSSLSLLSTTKGTMCAVLSSSLQMQEILPTDMAWLPYTTIPGKVPNYTASALAAILQAALAEAQDDVVTSSNTGDSYFSGKVLVKYAYVLHVCRFVLKNDTLVSTLMPKLKSAIGRFATNLQSPPLIYDTSYGGICSGGPASSDFGNPIYNDHHFHYGYHILAAALVAQVDSSMGGEWLQGVLAWVSTLVRDIANPSFTDPYFPFSRNFDWFNGHSWAGGLHASADGKDEESLLEDVNFAYAIKMWGKVTGDARMEGRGNLMLAVMRRSMNNYFYYSDGNTAEPARFVGNRVLGIMFDNKIDHTTYFGDVEAYIHGIHMLPMTPALLFVRPPVFVSQEWQQTVGALANAATDGWKGIMWLNAALFDPTLAYQFFTSPAFSRAYLDGGMSLTYAIAYCAGVGAQS